MHTIFPETYPRKKNPYKFAFFIILGAWIALGCYYTTEHIQTKKLVKDNEILVSQGRTLLKWVDRAQKDTLNIRILINPGHKYWIDTTFQISLGHRDYEHTDVFYGNFEGTVFHFLN